MHAVTAAEYFMAQLVKTDLNGRFITHKTERLDCPKKGPKSTQKTRSWKSESH